MVSEFELVGYGALNGNVYHVSFVFTLLYIYKYIYPVHWYDR